MGKKGLGSCDYLLLLLGAAGASMACSGAMFGYYRQAMPSSNINWPLRKYYLKKLTDKAMKPTVTWKQLKQDTCAKYEAAQMKYGTPAGKAANAMMSSIIVLPICGIKGICREHMSERCIFYDYISDDGLLLTLADFGAMALIGLSAFCLMVSSKPHWKMYAGIIAFVAGLAVVGLTGYWAYETHNFQMKMKEKTVWPYAPLNGWGFYANAGGGLFCCMAGVCGFISSLASGSTDAVPEGELLVGPMGGQPMGM